jgi:hypothetical protein
MITHCTTTSSTFCRLWSDSALRAVVPIFVVLRIVTLVLAFWTFKEFPPNINWSQQPIHYLHDMALNVQEPLHSWLEPWYRWDTGWYIYIVYNDYNAHDGTIIFAPLYPYAIRALGVLLGGQYLIAALLISNVACFIALLFFYKIVEAEFDSSTAHQTLILYMIFPTAFMLLAGYTESLFLAFLFTAWFAMKREKFVIAGLLAILCSLSRSQGWTLIFPFAYMAYIEPIRNTPNFKGNIRDFVLRLFAVTGGVIGTAIYLACMALAGLGNVNEAYDVLWDVKIVPPWTTILRAFQLAFTQSININDLISIGTLIFLFITGVLVVRRLKPQYGLYFWSTYCFILMRSYQPIDFQPTLFLSLVRYALTLFPVFITLALAWQQGNPRSNTQRMAYLIFACTLQIIQVVMFSAALWVA